MATERGQLWRIDCEATSGDSGGGVHVVYVLTDSVSDLPDADLAYRMTRGRDGGIYAYESIRPVDRVTDVDPYLDGVHDQRTRVVHDHSLFQ